VTPLARVIAGLFAALLALPAAAQDLPALSGRVVDQAELLSPEQEAGLTAKLEALEAAATRQLVVVTVPSLQDISIEDFAFRLGEAWKIGNAEADNGAIFLVAPNERRVRIEVGDGIEGILPDAMAWIIIRDRVTPKFKAGDMPGGISDGVDGIIDQLQAPLEVAEERARAAAAERQGSRSSEDDGWFVPLIVWGLIFLFFILPALIGGKVRRSTYRRRGGGLGNIILWTALDAAMRGGGRSSGGSWGGGGGGGFSGGGGGFSGGGGSFGGGGASGSW
jgi:uncharacterized protein